MNHWQNSSVMCQLISLNGYQLSQTDLPQLHPSRMVPISNNEIVLSNYLTKAYQI